MYKHKIINLKKVTFFFLSLFLSLGINLYLRFFPVSLVQFKIQARNRVEENIFHKVYSEFSQRYPDFKTSLRSKLVVKEVRRLKRVLKDKIASDVEKEYRRLKDFYQDEKGQTYLLELDGWHWLRYVENILHKGRPGDMVEAGQDMDMLMCAPHGTPIGWHRFLFYLTAGAYRLFSYFKPVSLREFVFYFPLFLAGLFFVLLYTFSYFFGGCLGALASSLFVGLAPIFLQRSCAGWFDTDILNMLFFLLVGWSYLWSFRHKNPRKKIFWLILSSFLVGLFSFTWNYWWVFFFLIIIYAAFSILNLLLESWQHKKDNSSFLKENLFSVLVFVLVSLLAVFLFSGREPFLQLFEMAKGVFSLNAGFTGSVWPNVYSTVGELSGLNLFYIGYYTGSGVLFILAFSAMLAIFLFYRRVQELESWKSQAICFFSLWALAMFFACSKGIRFLIFLLIPLGICLGWFIKLTFDLLVYKKKLIFILSMLLFAFYSVLFINSLRAASSILPLMNDYWYRMLVKLKENTPVESIINSWWDFGDWFKAVAQRRVIFDGQSQNLPQAHWMAYVFVSHSEEEALRILRMLNSSANDAFLAIDRQLNDPFAAAILLKSILKEGSLEGKKDLLNEEAQRQLIKMLMAKPDPAYFVLDNSLISKIKAISFLGNWDFAKAYLATKKKIYNSEVEYLIRFGVEGSEALRIVKEAQQLSRHKPQIWISKQLQFYGTLAEGNQDTKGVVFFDNGLVFDVRQGTASVYDPAERKYKSPKSIFFFDGNSYREMELSNSQLNFSVLILKEGGGYKSIFLDTELGNSLFVRLYFLNAFGLKHFKPFMEEKWDNGLLRVFEIIW